MRLPYGDRAIIDARKVVDYCLSLEHDDGKHKAQLFRDLLGLTHGHAAWLLDALKEAAANGEAVLGRADRYGQRYVVDFELVGPAGRAMVRAAWIIRTGETVPRLITCYIP
jgi:hypothetical protein